MPGRRPIIFELCLCSMGRFALFYLLLFGHGHYLSAQGSNEELLADRGQKDLFGIVETVHLPALGKIESSFQAGNYARVREDARALLAAVPGDSPDREALLFMEGVSLYYCGFYDQAQLSLDSCRLAFPGGAYAENLLYYAGSTLLKRGCWRAASRRLDEFRDRFPESLLMDKFLFDRATVHLSLHEYEACYRMAQRLIERYPKSVLIDQAAFLQGEVLKQTGQMVRAEGAFMTAKQLANEKGHKKVAAHSLCRLIEVACEQGRYNDAADYYDSFFLSFPQASRALEAAAAGLPALNELGRIHTALNRMEGMILEMPDRVAPQRIHKALDVYGQYFGTTHGFDDLLKLLRNLPIRARGKQTLQDAIVVARLEVLEKYFPDRDAEVEVFYDEIRSRLNRKDFSVCLILKVARHVARYNTQEAVLWLNEVLERSDIESRDEVIMALAMVQASSGNEEEMYLAKSRFECFINDYATPRLMEQGVVGLARASMQLREWSCARECWQIYLSHQDWKGARGEATRSLDRITKHELLLDQSPRVLPHGDTTGNRR